jgi:hypothetical protein
MPTRLNTRRRSAGLGHRLGRVLAIPRSPLGPGILMQREAAFRSSTTPRQLSSKPTTVPARNPMWPEPFQINEPPKEHRIGGHPSERAVGDAPFSATPSTFGHPPGEAAVRNRQVSNRATIRNRPGPAPRTAPASASAALASPANGGHLPLRGARLNVAARTVQRSTPPRARDEH